MTIEEKDLRISSLETKLEKLGKSYKEEVRDLKNDILHLKERVMDTEIHNSKVILILNNPPKLKGKSRAGVMVDFFNQFFNAHIVPADLNLAIFWARSTSLLLF